MSRFVLTIVYEGPSSRETIALGEVRREEAEVARDALLEGRRRMEASWGRHNVFFSRRVVSCEVSSG